MKPVVPDALADADGRATARTGPPKVASAALEVGYESEAAFGRAFKRIAGVAPAAWRARR